MDIFLLSDLVLFSGLIPVYSFHCCSRVQTHQIIDIDSESFLLYEFIIKIYIMYMIMPPTLKKLMGHIAFGASVSAWVRGSHFLYLL